MPFAAKSSSPNPSFCTYRHPTLRQATHNHLTIYTCSPGYLDTECLLAELLEQGRQVLWLRLEPEDGDPATFILSLLQAVQVQKPDLGAELIDKMRRSPGPVTGWPPLFQHMAPLLSDALGENGALVFEHVHKLAPIQPTLSLVGAHLVPHLPEHFACILITHERLPAAAFPGHAHPISEKDLQLTPQIAINLAQELELCIPDKVIKQAIHLLDGSAGALKALYAACDMFGRDYPQTVIQQGHNTSHVLTIILSRWLATFGDEEIQNLVLCSKIEYTHPDLFGVGMNEEIHRNCPWLQPLSNGWRRLRCLWNAPLRSALRNRTFVDYRVAQQLVQRLVEIGAIEKAIRLSCDINDYHAAAQVIAAHADQWMDLGQWELLEKCLENLPANILDDHPRLLFTQGEMLALHGRDVQAAQVFRKTSNLLLDHGDVSGGCRSLLAESVLSAHQENLDRAQFCALAALELARQAELAQFIQWAEWQLGSLAVYLDHLPEAVAFLTHSVDYGDDPFTRPIYNQVLDLIRQKVEAQEQIKSHYLAYLNADKTSREASRQLGRYLHATQQDLPDLLSTLRWSELPPMSKLASPIHRHEEACEHPSAGWRQRLQCFISQHLSKLLTYGIAKTVSPGEGISLLQLSFAAAGPEHSTQILAPGEEAQQQSPDLTIPAPAPERRSARLSNKALPVHKDRAQPSLAIFCLGPLRVFQKDKEITEWSSLKGRDIFKYLAARPETPIPKDILIDVFWPDADPRAARRNLHQAIYSLRQIMRGEQPDFQHIWFENDCYFINPQLDVWLDYKEFESYVAAGRHSDKAGRIQEAIEQFGTAEELYQGDFLEEDLYEDWPIVQRQNLLNQYLTIVDRLVELYLEKQQYAAAAPLCQKVLAKDRTYEAAHRQLMHCYLAQGLRHLAIRQFQTCARALREELDLEPSDETVALYSRLISQNET